MRWWGCWGATAVWELVGGVCVGSGEGWASFGRGRIFWFWLLAHVSVEQRMAGGKEKKVYLN